MAPQLLTRPDLGPPATLPVGDSVRVTGNTTRVGNVICAWYFAQLAGFVPAIFPPTQLVTPLMSTMHHLAAMQCQGDDEMCFGRYLLTPKDDSVEAVTPLADTKMRALSSLRIYVQAIKGASYAPELWPLYRSDFLSLVAEGLAKDLAPKMTAYAEKYDPRLLAPPPSPTHCVVHYRAGDYGDFMRMHYSKEDASRLPANWSVPMLSVDSVARAVASFKPPPETVEILNGELCSLHVSPPLLLAHGLWPSTHAWQAAPSTWTRCRSTITTPTPRARSAPRSPSCSACSAPSRRACRG